jgi:hypothetical protein
VCVCVCVCVFQEASCSLACGPWPVKSLYAAVLPTVELGQSWVRIPARGEAHFSHRGPLVPWAAFLPLLQLCLQIPLPGLGQSPCLVAGVLTGCPLSAFQSFLDESGLPVSENYLQLLFCLSTLPGSSQWQSSLPWRASLPAGLFL